MYRVLMYSKALMEGDNQSYTYGCIQSALPWHPVIKSVISLPMRYCVHAGAAAGAQR